jgi:hypothetical protein
LASPMQSAPLTYDIGLDFNYALWNENSDIKLVNVPYNSTYRDILKPSFNTSAYVDSLPGTQISLMSYLRANAPIRIDTPFSVASNYNYIRVRNGGQPIPGDQPIDYFYFITAVRFITPGTTELVIQLDVWSTYKSRVTLGNSFVERSHAGIANENNFVNFGRNFLTHPEGLDTGKDYRVVRHNSRSFMQNNDEGYDVLLVCNINLFEADFGTLLKPVVNSAYSSTVQGMTEAGDWIIFRPAMYREFLKLMTKYPWITQGIVSITLIPRISNYRPDFDYDHAEAILFDGGAGGPNDPAPDITPAIPDTIKYAYLDATAAVSTTELKSSYALATAWRDTLLDFLPEKYRKLKKLLTAPYLQIEITTWNATPIVLNPENWADANGQISELVSIVPPYQQAVFMPRGYNAEANYTVDSKLDDGGEFLDLATRINDFPTMSILNDAASIFLASNANQFAYAEGYAADWSQQRAMLGANQAASNANQGIGAQRATTENNNAALLAQMNNQALVSGVNSGLTSAQGVISTDPVGGISGGVFNTARTAFDIYGMSTAATISADTATRNTEISTGAAQGIADSNLDLAKTVAQGDKLSAIMAVNAKVTDARAIPPSSSGQIGGNAINLINGSSEVSIRFKMIDQAHIHNIGDIWLRYGYAINQRINVIPPDLMVMTKFTFWKMTETYVNSSAMSESMKQTITGIFQQGTTVWDDPTYIGNTDMGDNQIIPGFVMSE